MLKELLPERLREIPQLAAVLDAEEPEAKAALDAVYDFLAQLNVDTATWGLALWEQDYGITPLATAMLADRRAAVKNRMRGMATTTAKEIERMVSQVMQGTCQVEEVPAEYLVRLRIYADTGEMAKLDACKKQVRDILPAHLDLETVLLYPFAYRVNLGASVRIAQKITIG